MGLCLLARLSCDEFVLIVDVKLYREPLARYRPAELCEDFIRDSAEVVLIYETCDGNVTSFGSFGFGLALVLCSTPSPEFSGSFLFWFVFLTELRKAVPFLTDWFSSIC